MIKRIRVGWLHDTNLYIGDQASEEVHRLILQIISMDCANVVSSVRHAIKNEYGLWI